VLTVLQPELVLSEHVIRQGQKHEVDGRGWARLAHKIATGSTNIKIVAFGGSVSVGYRMSNTSYPEQFTAWLQEAFPKVKFELVNLARRATAATFAALCLVQDMPQDADLVLIEYSVNGHGG
jgi:lysophospholipase L1-like esterase